MVDDSQRVQATGQGGRAAMTARRR